MVLDLAPSRYVHWRLQNHATRFPTRLWSSPRLRPPVGCEQSNPSRGRATTPPTAWYYHTCASVGVCAMVASCATVVKGLHECSRKRAGTVAQVECASYLVLIMRVGSRLQMNSASESCMPHHDTEPGYRHHFLAPHDEQTHDVFERVSPFVVHCAYSRRERVM